MLQAASMRRVAGTGRFETYMAAKDKLCSCSYKLDDSMKSVPIADYGFVEGEKKCPKCDKMVAIIVDSRENGGVERAGSP
jgi:hypothetical protein